MIILYSRSLPPLVRLPEVVDRGPADQYDETPLGGQTAPNGLARLSAFGRIRRGVQTFAVRLDRHVEVVNRVRPVRGL